MIHFYDIFNLGGEFHKPFNHEHTIYHSNNKELKELIDSVVEDNFQQVQDLFEKFQLYGSSALKECYEDQSSPLEVLGILSNATKKEYSHKHFLYIKISKG